MSAGESLSTKFNTSLKLGGENIFRVSFKARKEKFKNIFLYTLSTKKENEWIWILYDVGILGSEILYNIMGNI